MVCFIKQQMKFILVSPQLLQLKKKQKQDPNNLKLYFRFLDYLIVTDLPVTV